MDEKMQSRRRFFGTAVGAVGALGTLGAIGGSRAAAPGSADLSQRKPTKDAYDVVVVGAGFAGLAASRELSRAGLDVLLLEARNRIGGRTFTTHYRDEKVELGGTWVHWSQPFVWSEMIRYGLGIEETIGATAETASWLTGGRLKHGETMKALPALAMAMEKYCDVDKMGGRAAMALPHDPMSYKGGLAPWDKLSMQDRLNRVQLDPQSRDMLSAMLASTSSSNLSEGAFTDVLHWWSLSDFDLVRFFDKNTRFKIKEGMGALAQQMLMDSTAEVALSTPVRSIDKSGSTYQVTTAGDKGFRARAVVMAVPQNVLSSIAITPELSAGKRLMAANGHAGRGTKCYIHVRQKIGKWIGMAPAPNPISVVFTDREMADGSLLACFGPPGKLDITDEAAVQSALRQLLPKVEVVGVTGYQWAADPYSRGTWCWYRPGQLTAGWEDMRRAEGGLFMAGSDVAEGWRGFVDGAIESGYTAARDVRAFLKG